MFTGYPLRTCTLVVDSGTVILLSLIWDFCARIGADDVSVF